MVENLPFKTIKHKDLTVQGYSRAAVQSYWRIPEMKLGFDLGGQPWDFMGTPNWFVSHCHLDHIAALPVLIARRRMMKMDPPNLYLPEHSIGTVEQMLKAFSRLDRGRLPCNLVAAKVGDEFHISRELVVTCHETRHTVPSLGFIVWQKRNKLKEEYQELSGEQIRELRLSGQEVSTEKRSPRIAYLGDSRPESLDANPAMYEAEILITEVTFVTREHRSDKIHKLGHIHLDDMIARRDKFQNELIIASHFSTRYHPRQIRTAFQNALPNMLDGRLQLVI